VNDRSRARRPLTETAPPPAASPMPVESPNPPKRRSEERLPYLLDFFPLESGQHTRLARFYERLREGRLSTTRCAKDDLLLWPPRTACPRCHAESLDWVDLPASGHVYAFSAVLAGAPLGMEEEVPFAVGLVDLDGVPLRLFGRIEGKAWNALHVGERVEVEPFEIGDGRCFYRFRAGP
jgi:uncharacterized protein